MIEIEIFLYIIVITLIIYSVFHFFVQPLRKERIQEVLDRDAMDIGDTVKLYSGLYGRIKELKRNEEKVILDCEGVFLTFDLKKIEKIVEKN